MIVLVSVNIGMVGEVDEVDVDIVLRLVRAAIGDGDGRKPKAVGSNSKSATTVAAAKDGT
jgi:hypothetical protein